MSQFEHFSFSISDSSETGLVLVSVTDSRTGFTVRTALPNSGTQTASIMAFAGARYSRSALSAEDLFREIKASGKDASEKLANIFRNYGHSSVADMAMLFAYVENIPKLHAVKFFYETSVGGGQERSSRFQDYSKSKPIELRKYVQSDDSKYGEISSLFMKLQNEAIANYIKYKEVLTNKFIEVYEINQDDKKEMSALPARVFDSARYFLPSGVLTRSSLAFITSAREWARIISTFKSTKDFELICLAEQLEILFAPEESEAKKLGYVPEAPDLIRYTTSDETTSNNLNELKNYLEKNHDFSKTAKFLNNFNIFTEVKTAILDENMSTGLKIVMQNILTVYPSVDEKWLAKWLNALPTATKTEIGGLLLNGFNHHKQMGNQFRVNALSFVLETSICEGLDLNRHRAWGRFMPMLSTESDFSSLINTGYTLPAYLYDNEKLSKVRKEFEGDLINYFNSLKEFILKVENLEWFPKSLLIQLFPLAAIMKTFMHASPKEVSYMTKLRVRPGGHINYRISAYQIADLTALKDPFLKGLKLTDIEKPNPSSRAEFLDRS